MSKRRTLAVVFIFLFFISSCHFRGTYHIATVDNNVCKKLYGNVILYAVFVDSKSTHPWTEYDINSTLDSIQKACTWLEEKALENDISLNIELVYHQNGRTIPLIGDLPNKSVGATLFSPLPPVGIPKLDRWADRIAKA